MEIPTIKPDNALEEQPEVHVDFWDCGLQHVRAIYTFDASMGVALCFDCVGGGDVKVFIEAARLCFLSSDQVVVLDLPHILEPHSGHDYYSITFSAKVHNGKLLLETF